MLPTMLVTGRTGYVTLEETDALAIWIAKTCMMAQLTHPESAATPMKHYEWLYRNRTPPPGWNIWVMPISAQDWGLRIQYWSVLYGDPSTIDVSDPCNVHSTTIGLGRVGFCAMASAGADIAIPPLETSPLGAVRLWPEIHAFGWTRDQPLDNNEIWLASDLLRLQLTDEQKLWEAIMRVAARRAP